MNRLTLLRRNANADCLDTVNEERTRIGGEDKDIDEVRKTDREGVKKAEEVKERNTEVKRPREVQNGFSLQLISLAATC